MLYNNVFLWCRFVLPLAAWYVILLESPTEKRFLKKFHASSSTERDSVNSHASAIWSQPDYEYLI